MGEHHSELAAVTQPVSERAGCGPGLSDPASHAFNSYQVPRVLNTGNGGGHGGRGWMLQNCTCQGDLDLVALLTLYHRSGGSVVKNPPPVQKIQETRLQSLGWEDPLDEEMATHSSILAWKNPTDRGAWWATVHGVAKSWM